MNKNFISFIDPDQGYQSEFNHQHGFPGQNHGQQASGQRQSRDLTPIQEVRGPRLNSDIRPNPWHASGSRDQTTAQSQLPAEVLKQNSTSRAWRDTPTKVPRPAVPDQSQGDVVENVLGEVLKIIDNRAFIFCKIDNKNGTKSDYVSAKYYPFEKRNFGVIM